MLNQVLSKFQALSQREQRIVLATILLIGLWIPYEFFGSEDLSLSSTQSESSARISQLVGLKDSIERYQKLSARAEQIERNYATSQFTTEEVFSEVEKIIRESLGSDAYELRPVPNAVTISPTVEQQLFNLKIRSVTLPQLVAVLYRMEQGKAPLFLGKLEVSKSTQPGNFQANIELSSLRKKRNA